MSYGIRLSDELEKKLTLTPNLGTVIAAGRTTMPDSLKDDDTYGVDIDLPGTTAISEDDISVMIIPSRPVSSILYSQYAGGGTMYYNTHYMNSASTYYSRNESTGVMTSWTAGNRTLSNVSTWDPVLSVCPVAFWDKMGETEFTSVRLFAATAYMLKIPAVDVNYALASNGASTTISLSPINFGPSNYYKDNSIDNNTSTGVCPYWYDWGGGELLESWYIVDVTWSTPRDITVLDIVYYTYGTRSGGSNQMVAAVEIYYNSAWHAIGYQQVSNQNNGTWTAQNYRIGVFATGVTGIRCEGYWGSWGGGAAAGCDLREIRAWGVDYSSGTPEAIRYSIGSAGVATVDYAVSIKKWDY